jgi:hypothetical protein
LNVFVRNIASPNPAIVSSRNVNATLSLFLIKRHEKMHVGFMYLTSALEEGFLGTLLPSR